MKTIDVWKKTMEKVWKEGYTYVDSDNRKAREMQNVVITIKNVEEAQVEWPVNYMYKTDKWLYPSKEEITNVMFKEFHSPVYDYTYGGRIFNFSGELDQVEKYVVPLLSKDEDSRRAVICIYNPLKDSYVHKRNVPGIMYIVLRVIDEKLFLTGMLRSTDLFFGWPANFYQLYCIQKLIAGKLNLKLGELSTVSNSAHVFESSVEDIKDLLGDFI